MKYVWLTLFLNLIYFRAYAFVAADNYPVFWGMRGNLGFPISKETESDYKNKIVWQWFEAVKRADLAAMQQLITDDELVIHNIQGSIASIVQHYNRNKNKISINIRDRNGCTALMWAILYGSINIVKFLLSLPNIDVNIQNNSKSVNALIIASALGYDKIVTLLLTVPGIKINAQDSDGETALMWAAKKGYQNVVRCLLAAPEIDINIQNNKGDTALFATYTYSQHDNIVQLLLDTRGINVNTVSDLGDETLLIVAAKKGDEILLKKLAKMPAFDVNAPNKSGYTALMYSAKPHFTKRLLQVAGINVNAQSRFGSTAIHWAASRNHESNIRLLLQNGVNVNIQDETGQTALMSAAQCGYQKIVSLLLAVPDINMGLQDKTGKTAYIHAIEKNRQTIAALIKSKIDELIPAAFESVFAFASSKSISSFNEATSDAERQINLDKLKSIIAQIGVDNIVDEFGNTLLDKAFAINSPEIIIYLLQHAYDPQELLSRFPFESISPSSLIFEYMMKLAYAHQQNTLSSSASSKVSSRNKSRICKMCGREASERCAKCKKVYYCSEKCQKTDWKFHKSNCI